MLIESVLYISLGAFLLFALLIYLVRGKPRSNKIEKKVRLTRAQLGCHGIWLGQHSERENFYFCLHEIGQFIEGVFYQDGKQSQFSGTYLAPVLTFEKMDDDGSTKTFRGVVDASGNSISGQCTEYGSERFWSAKLISEPAQTKSLDLDVLSRLTLTHMSPEGEAARAALLTNVERSLVLEEVGDANVKVGKVASDNVVPSASLLTELPVQVPMPAGPVQVQVSATPPPVGVVGGDGTTLCPKCHSPVDKAFHFCLHCGHSHSSDS